MRYEVTVDNLKVSLSLCLSLARSLNSVGRLLLNDNHIVKRSLHSSHVSLGQTVHFAYVAVLVFEYDAGILNFSRHKISYNKDRHTAGPVTLRCSEVIVSTVEHNGVVSHAVNVNVSRTTVNHGNSCVDGLNNLSYLGVNIVTVDNLLGG